MAIKVKSGQISDGIKTYVVGETMTGLPAEEEARLISLGFAEAADDVGDVAEAPAVDKENPEDQVDLEYPEDTAETEDQVEQSDVVPEKVFDLNAEEYVAAGNKKTTRRK